MVIEGPNIRKISTLDLKNLAELVNSAYRGESSKAGWTTEADLLGGQRTDPDSLAQMILNEQTILVAEDSQKNLLGCVYLKKAEANKAYLGMLTVKPKLQAQGLGKKLLFAGEKFAQENWQAKAMQMTVISVREELIAWYLRHGYKKTDKTENFPYGDSRFGLPKRPDLLFIVLEKEF